MDSIQPKPQKMFYRVSTVAQMLDISRSKAYQMIESNELCAVKFGASIRVSAEALANFVQRKTVEGLGA